MPFINDSIFDNGLTSIASATSRRMDLCQTAEPTTYTEATSTNTIGNKTGLTMGAIENGATDGRRVQSPAFSDGTVTTAATGGWWALTDATSVLHAAGAVSASQAVSIGNPWSLAAVSITIRDAA